MLTKKHTNSSQKVFIIVLFLVALLGIASPVYAEIFQIDTSGLFDKDIVINSGDTTNVGIDTEGHAYITQSIADASLNCSMGIPDNGFIAANSYHPAIQLAAQDSNLDENAFIGGSGNFEIDVPDDK